jgi:hypothetical protein
VNQIFSFALANPALLLVPAAGFVAALALHHVKKRYVHDGVLLGFQIETPKAAVRSLGAGASARTDRKTTSSLEIDPNLWILALDGILARYASLTVPMCQRNHDEKTHQLLKSAVSEWHLVRSSLDARSAKHFALELKGLDSIAEKVFDRGGSTSHIASERINKRGNPENVPNRPDVFPYFLAELHAFRQKAWSWNDKPEATDS